MIFGVRLIRFCNFSLRFAVAVLNLSGPTDSVDGYCRWHQLPMDQQGPAVPVVTADDRTSTADRLDQHCRFFIRTAQFLSLFLPCFVPWFSTFINYFLCDFLVDLCLGCTRSIATTGTADRRDQHCRCRPALPMAGIGTADECSVLDC